MATRKYDIAIRFENRAQRYLSIEATLEMSERLGKIEGLHISKDMGRAGDSYNCWVSALYDYDEVRDEIRELQFAR